MKEQKIHIVLAEHNGLQNEVLIHRYLKPFANYDHWSAKELVRINENNREARTHTYVT